MAPAAVQPDISYEPDLEKYQNRTKRRLECEDTSQPLPEGFPPQLKSDLVWDAKDFPPVGSGNEPWVYELSVAELEEINLALAHFKSLYHHLSHIYVMKLDKTNR